MSQGCRSCRNVLGQFHTDITFRDMCRCPLIPSYSSSHHPPSKQSTSGLSTTSFIRRTTSTSPDHRDHPRLDWHNEVSLRNKSLIIIQKILEGLRTEASKEPDSITTHHLHLFSASHRVTPTMITIDLSTLQPYSPSVLPIIALPFILLYVQAYLLLKYGKQTGPRLVRAALLPVGLWSIGKAWLGYRIMSRSNPIRRVSLMAMTDRVVI